ncbi:MAG TPA: hypothetical protein VFF69_10755 [Phycisphaerales bacterium]|nr:hypothetical protein [Phycisphaerales bacterium]
MRLPRLAPALLVACSCAAAQGQTDDDRFRPIEEGFDDVSPQAESNRLQPVDTRIPLDFTRVYEIIDAPGLLARRSGAVTAVFPRSIYNADASAPIPPGTVFYVGDLPVDLAQPGMFTPNAPGLAAPARAGNRLDTAAGARIQTPIVGARIDLRVPAAGPALGATPESDQPAPTMWQSEAYRQQRVGDILRRVVRRVSEPESRAAGERARQPSEESPSSPPLRTRTERDEPDSKGGGR